MADALALATKSKNQQLQAFVYYAIAHHFVFNTTTLNDHPIRRQRKSNKGDHSRDSENQITRRYIVFMEWLAATACVASTALFILIFCAPGWLLESWIPPTLVPSARNGQSLWAQSYSYAGGNVERWHFIARVTWGMLMSVVIATVTRDTVRYFEEVHVNLQELKRLADDGIDLGQASHQPEQIAAHVET